MTEQTATATISVADFRTSFLALWKEIFEPAGDGPYWILDGGTSLLETLAGISAADASIPVSKQSATLAAQVNHIAYYIEELREGLATDFTNVADWAGSWQVDAVDDAEWQVLIERLRANYEWLAQRVNEMEIWEANDIGSAMAMIAHAAYHLGEIRQGIGIVRNR